LNFWKVGQLIDGYYKGRDTKNPDLSSCLPC